MKSLTTLTCAAAAAGALALGASSAQAVQPTLPPVVGSSTNYDPLNITLTIQETSTKVDNDSNYVTEINTKTYTDKNLLSLLSSSDFAGEDLTNIGAQVVVSWDAGNGNITNGNWGDILVVKGTNVFYDATTGTILDGVTNHVSVNFFYGYNDNGDWGAYAETDPYELGKPGFDRETVHETAEFVVQDNGSSYINLDSFGPGVITLDQNWTRSSEGSYTYTSGFESEHFTTFENTEDIGGGNSSTATVRISGSGHTKGIDYLWWYE